MVMNLVFLGIYNSCGCKRLTFGLLSLFNVCLATLMLAVTIYSQNIAIVIN
jgi:hypothetical protein